jgi:hypothetical protein
MDMYVRMYDDLKRGPDDNPTVGILLCGTRIMSVVRYSVLHDSEQLFASKYRLVLPSEEELRQRLTIRARVFRMSRLWRSSQSAAQPCSSGLAIADYFYLLRLGAKIANPALNPINSLHPQGTERGSDSKRASRFS